MHEKVKKSAAENRSPRESQQEGAARQRFLDQSRTLDKTVHGLLKASHLAREAVKDNKEIRDDLKNVYYFNKSVKREAEQGGEREESSFNQQQVGEARTRIYNWYAEQFPAAAHYIESALNGVEEKDLQSERQRLQAQMVDVLAKMVQANQSLSASTLNNKRVDHVAYNSIAHELVNLPQFALVKSIIESATFSVGRNFKEVNLQEAVAGVQQYVEVQDALREVLNPQAAVYEARKWVQKHARAARHGESIFPTPYYLHAISAIQEAGNGNRDRVAGTLLEGPPGTGKTELLKEANRAEGYDTVVISMHYYSNFAELVATRGIHLVGAPSSGGGVDVDILQRRYGNTADFQKDFSTIYESLRTEGKLDSTITLNRFMADVIGLSSNAKQARELRQGLVSSSNIDSQMWGQIKDVYFSHLRASELRSTLSNPSWQELVEDVVKGEIALAIAGNKRVVLDEIDKAGPGSTTGLYNLLSSKPGGKLSYGGSDISVPHWFRIDATSNDVSAITGPLLDRFNKLQVQAPMKDQLMIAAVLTADTQGNSLLTSREQSNLVGFFMYVLPQINALLASRNRPTPPLSVRFIQTLAANLVNASDQMRSQKPFNESLLQALRQRITGWDDDLQEKVMQLPGFREITADSTQSTVQRIVSFFDGQSGQQVIPPESQSFKDEEIAEAMEEVLRGRESLRSQVEEARAQEKIFNEPVELKELDREALRQSAVARLQTQQRRKAVEAWVETNIEQSPILQAIGNLPDVSSIGNREVFEFVLSSDQAADIHIQQHISHAVQALRLQGMGRMTLSAEVSTGVFSIAADGGSQGIIRVVNDEVKSGISLYAASADGGRVLLSSSGQKNNTSLKLVGVFSNETVFSMDLGTRRLKDVQLDQAGEVCGVLDTSSGFMLRRGEKVLMPEVQNVRRFQVSPDGRLLLLETSNGMQLYSVSSDRVTLMQQEAFSIPNSTFYLSGNNIIIRQQQNGEISSNAFYVQ